MQRPCGTRELGVSPGRRPVLREVRVARAGGMKWERWAQAGSSRVSSAAVGQVLDFYSTMMGSH